MESLFRWVFASFQTTRWLGISAAKINLPVRSKKLTIIV